MQMHVFLESSTKKFFRRETYSRWVEVMMPSLWRVFTGQVLNEYSVIEEEECVCKAAERYLGSMNGVASMRQKKVQKIFVSLPLFQIFPTHITQCLSQLFFSVCFS